MQCPFCDEDQGRVIDTRNVPDGIRRRRRCLSCDRRFTTFERVENTPRIVVKKDKRREFFDRAKVLRGARIACQKRAVSEHDLEALVASVEAEVFGRFDTEVSSRFIGECVSERLKELDPVAYVRFASVYREFQDVGQFYRELAPLLSFEAPAELGTASCAETPLWS